MGSQKHESTTINIGCIRIVSNHKLYVGVVEAIDPETVQAPLSFDECTRDERPGSRRFMVEVNPFDAVVEVDVGAITGQIHGKCGWDIRWKSYVAHKWILWIEPLDKKNCVNKE